MWRCYPHGSLSLGLTTACQSGRCQDTWRWPAPRVPPVPGTAPHGAGPGQLSPAAIPEGARPVLRLRLRSNARAGPGLPAHHPLCLQLADGQGWPLATTSVSPWPPYSPPRSLVDLVGCGKHVVGCHPGAREWSVAWPEPGPHRETHVAESQRRETHGGPLAGSGRQWLTRHSPGRSRPSRQRRSSLWVLRFYFMALPCERFPLAFPDVSEREGQVCPLSSLARRSSCCPWPVLLAGPCP